MAKRPAVKFAAVDPVTERHSGVFRVWTRKADTYVATEDDGGIYKVSLHRGIYRVAYTSEHWASGAAPNNASGPGRNIVSYPPSEAADGVEYAWRLVFQTDALLRSEPLSDDVLRVRPERPNDVVQVNVWICERSVTARPRWSIGEPLLLADGRVVRLGVDTFSAESEDGQVRGRRDYVGAIFEFADRNRPDDAPGLILRPFDIG
jgi:hypothetical protein